MIVETEISVSAPEERVWQELSDLEALAAVVPGSEMTRVDGDAAVQGTLRPELGGTVVECIGTLRPIDFDEDNRSATCHFRVREAHGPGFAVGTLRGRVTGAGEAARVAVTLDGRLAAPGVDETSVRDDAEKLLAALAAGLEKSLSERASRPPAREPATLRPAPAVEPAAPTAAAARPPALALAGVLALVLALLLGRRSRRRSARFELPW